MELSDIISPKKPTNKKKVNVSSILKKDRPSLLLFTCWYSLIGTNENNKSLNKKYPPTFTSDITNIFAKNELVRVGSHGELMNLEQPLSKSFVCYVSNRSKCIDLLCHIRNAMAHDSIEYDKDKKQFYLRDYNMNGNLTAYGKLEASKLYAITDMVLNRAGISK